MAEAATITPAVTVEAFAMELLKDPMKDWYTMGFLLGLYEHTLKDIVWKHRPNGIEACLRGIFDTLKDQGVKLTWEQIIDALSTAAMDCKELAEEINQKYCGGTYTSTHGTDEEHQNDQKLAEFLHDICRGCDLTHDDSGFFLIKDISRKTRRSDLTEENVRRAVAITPHLRLDKGPLMKIRTNCDHKDAKLQNLKKDEGHLYHYVSTICRFENEKLPIGTDGSFAVQDIIDLKIDSVFGTDAKDKYRAKYTEQKFRRAVKYGSQDELLLVEHKQGLRIKHIAIHPEPSPEHTDKWLWSDVRSCCCKASYKNIEYDKVEGYVEVHNIVKALRKQQHNKDLEMEDVIHVVKNCPPNCPPEWLLLDEGPPPRVKATWGHCMPVERPQTTPLLTVADEIPPLVISMHARNVWVKQKHGIKAYTRYRIELYYLNHTLDTDEEMFKQYGYHQVIAVIDLAQAIKDGLKFYRQPPKIIVCHENCIPIKYIKKIL